MEKPSKRVLTLDPYQHGVVIHALNELRNDLIHEQRPTDIVDSLDFHVTPHQLRHTYITNLLYMGVDPKTVQYLAGHKNSKTTMDIYAKIKYNKPQELLPVVNAALRPVAMS